jgi:hypothetical protein
VKDRRAQLAPSEMPGYLHQLGSMVLLDRLPVAMIGIGPVGRLLREPRLRPDARLPRHEDAD